MPFHGTHFLLCITLFLTSALALASARRTVSECATHLDCSITDLETFLVRERQQIIAQAQAIHGPALGASDRWTIMLGVMDFFVANGLGDAAGTWFSVCDCAIVEGVLRGVAMALDPHASDFGNPSAALWRDYALSLRRWDIRTRKDRGEHDRAWAVAEFAGTEYGRHVAEGVRGIEITGPEWRWMMLTQLYRLLMILHHGLVIETSKLLSLLLRGHSKSLLDWTTDVRLREPARAGLQVAWELANFRFFRLSLATLRVLEAYGSNLLMGRYRNSGRETPATPEHRRDL